MLYDAYEVQRSMMAGASRLAGLGAGWLNNPSKSFSTRRWAGGGRRLGCSRMPCASRNPSSGRDRHGGQGLVHDEQMGCASRWAFEALRQSGCRDQPPLLIVGPMSGPFATLLAHV